MENTKIFESNEYFANLKKIGDAYEDAIKEIDEKMSVFKTAGDWDNPELKQLYAEKEKMQKEFGEKYPQGVWKAYRAWFWSMRDDRPLVELNDFLWDKEVSAFVETLSRAGIEAFDYYNHSTAVMDNFYDFIENGCSMDCRSLREEKDFGETHYVKGMHFIVPKFKEA